MKIQRAPLLYLLILVTVLAGSFIEHEALGSDAEKAAASDPDSLAALVTDLRLNARFAEARQVALQLFNALKEDSSTHPWEVDDANRLASLMESAAGLPEFAQKELAEADRLNTSVRELWQKKEYGSAGDLVQRQLEIRKRILGESVQEVARTYTTLAYYRNLQDSTDEAINAFQRARAIYEDLGIRIHPAVAYILKYLGTLLYDRGDYKHVLSMWEERIAITRKLYGNKHASVAEALADVGELHRKTGNYKSALESQREALSIRRSLFGDGNLHTIGSIYNLALLYHNLGDYAAAEFLHLKALSLYRILLPEDDSRIIRSMDALANVHTDLGELGKAESLLREVLEICKRQLPTSQQNIARHLNNLAALLYKKEDYDEAVSLFRQALELKQKAYGENHPEIILNMHNLALCQMRLGNLEAADSLLRKELDLTRRTIGEKNRSIAECYHDLGRNLVERTKYAEANEAFIKAIELYRFILGGEHPYVALVLTDFAFCYTAQNHFEPAESLLVEAAGIYEVARRRAGTGFVRSTFQESPYWLLAAARLEIGKNEEAWRAIEGALGRSLSDLLFESGEQILTPREAACEDSLQKKLGDLQDMVAALQETSDEEAKKELLRTTTADLAAAEAAWKGFQIEIAEKYPVAIGRGYTLDHVQRVLDAKSALIGWLHVEIGPARDVTWGYVVRNKGPAHWVRLSNPNEADASFAAVATAHDLRKLLRKAAAWPARVTYDPIANREARKAKTIYDYWFAPLKPPLAGVENLIVVPAGPLLGIPLSVLVDADGAFLDETYAISYVPSATVYAWLCEQETRGRSGAGRRSLLVGNPVSAGGEETLPWAEKEIQAIASTLINSDAFLGTAATEQCLSQLATTDSLRFYDMIHFATHARVYDDKPNLSALVLSKVNLPDPLSSVTRGSPIFDGRITAEEIVRNWNLNANLVILSGCETALGMEHIGEGFIGLAHAFLQAGTRSLITSLWRVEDESTSMLMQRFYSNLTTAESIQAVEASGISAGSKSAALREAKMWLRNYTDQDGERPFAHPVYWSGFVLSGKP